MSPIFLTQTKITCFLSKSHYWEYCVKFYKGVKQFSIDYEGIVELQRGNEQRNQVILEVFQFLQILIKYGSLSPPLRL